MHLALRFSLLVLISTSLFVGCQRGKKVPVGLQQADGEALPELRNVAERDDDDVKHPLIRRLLQMLDEIDDGADDERRMIRRTLIDADIELRKSNPQRAIRRANNPYRRRVGRVSPIIRRPPQTTKRATKKEAPKKEAPKKEAAKKEAPKKEAVKKEAVKKEAVKKEAVKKEAVKKEAVKKEAAKKEAPKKEAVKKEAVKKEAAKKEAAKKEAPKKEATK